MMNDDVTACISSAPEPHRAVMEKVRDLLHGCVPGLKESYKWSRPVFGTKKDFAYLQANKAHVSLGFYRFDVLDDPDGLLEGSGKTMRHIKLRNLSDIDEPLLRKWFTILAQSASD